MTIRKAIADLKVLEKIRDEQIVDDMISYFNRREDHSQVKDMIVMRYGQRLRKIQDPNNPDKLEEVYEPYEKTSFAKKVDSGMVGAVTMGFSNKVANAHATLFTQETQKYKLTHETIEDVTEAEELLSKKRKKGKHKVAMVKADKQSIEIGSSLVFVSHKGFDLMYQRIPPSAIRAYWADTIIHEGEERAVYTDDLEDATVIVIRLGAASYTTYNYLAIFGESDEYPDGRWVRYESTPQSTAIPPFGSEEAYDFKLPGNSKKPANPLTYMKKQYPEMGIPEYPLAVILGGVTDDDDPCPVYTSLYEDSKEIDLAGSHLISTSQEAARGTRAIERDATAKSYPLPKTTSGTISLLPGQRMVDVPHRGENSKHAMDVLTEMKKSTGGGYSVPDFLVVSEDHMFDASSGVALDIKSIPLKEARKFRIGEVTASVDKIFMIEKAYIAMFAKPEERNAANLLLECEQTWDPGELRLPENKLEEANRIISLKSAGVLDEIAAIQEYYKLPTIDEAIEVYEEMRKRKEDYPPIDAQQQQQQQAPQANPTFGLRGRAREANNDGGNNSQRA